VQVPIRVELILRSCEMDGFVFRCGSGGKHIDLLEPGQRWTSLSPSHTSLHLLSRINHAKYKLTMSHPTSLLQICLLLLEVCQQASTHQSHGRYFLPTHYRLVYLLILGDFIICHTFHYMFIKYGGHVGNNRGYEKSVTTYKIFP
jgi:hypothetical protein